MAASVFETNAWLSDTRDFPLFVFATQFGTMAMRGSQDGRNCNTHIHNPESLQGDWCPVVCIA